MISTSAKGHLPKLNDLIKILKIKQQNHLSNQKWFLTATSNKAPAILEKKELPKAYFFRWLYVHQVLARWPLRSHRACHTLSLYPRPRLNARDFVRCNLNFRQILRPGLRYHCDKAEIYFRHHAFVVSCRAERAA